MCETQVVLERCALGIPSIEGLHQSVTHSLVKTLLPEKRHHYRTRRVKALQHISFWCFAPRGGLLCQVGSYLPPLLWCVSPMTRIVESPIHQCCVVPIIVWCLPRRLNLCLAPTCDQGTADRAKWRHVSASTRCMHPYQPPSSPPRAYCSTTARIRRFSRGNHGIFLLLIDANLLV